LVLSPELTITAVSDAYLATTPHERPALLGRAFFEVFPDDASVQPPVSGANLRASLARVIERYQVDCMPVQARALTTQTSNHALEERYWGAVNTPVFDEDGRLQFVLHSVDDMTELFALRARERQHELALHALANREHKYELLLDAAPDAMVVVGEDGLIDLVNAQTEQVFGYAREQLIDRPLEMLMPERYRRAHASHVARFFKHPVGRPMGKTLELVGRRCDGSEFPIDVGLSPLRTEDGTIISAAIRDITQRKQAEAAAIAKVAEAASAARSEFLASMSHELRTPMNAILGFAQLLHGDKKEPLGPRHRRRLEQILHGGEHLLRLIDDVLDLAQIEAGGVALTTETVQVPDVVVEVTRTLEPFAARHGIKLEVAAVSGPVPLVAADRARLAQVLIHFGTNAIKYNRAAGSVRFRIESPDPSHTRVSVEDTGIGVPVERQAHLFQPFQRVGQEFGPIAGTGIGLVISKRLAELMSGSVGFHSLPGGGSAFWVELPSR
jgi:protein-histidine pros-kinase